MESSVFLDSISQNKKIVFNAGFEASIDYAERRTNFVPNVQLIFSPFGLPFVPIEVLGTNTNKIITSLTWTKDRNNPGGVLAVEMAPDSKIINDIVKTINKYSANLYSKIWGELGVDLEDLFKPMTLCQLWIDGYHVMTGTVRSCNRASSVSNTDKNVSYSITVDELGNIYNMNTLSLDSIYLDGMQTQIVDSFKKAFDLDATIKGTTLANGIKRLIDAFRLSSLEQGLSFSDGFPLFYRLLSEANPLGGISNVSLANFITVDSSLFQLNSQGGGQNSIWSFIKSFIPSPWMEFFTESGGRTMVTDGLGVPSVLFPGFNYTVARTVPYSNPILGTVNPAHLLETLPFDLNTLNLLIGGDFIIITDDMIMEKNLGFDSTNQFTVFHSRYGSKGVSSGPDLNDKGIKSIGPLNPFASGGITTFGMREMFQSIDCSSLIGLGTSASYVERIAKNIFGLPFGEISKNALSNLLAVWFRNQSRFREGQVIARNIPYARPGMYCLYLPSLSGKKVENLRDIGIYYIDSLSHEYNIQNTDLSHSTTLNLIRGVPLPTTVAQTALLLFDFEVLPPLAGYSDGEATVVKQSREAISQQAPGVGL